MSIDDKLKNNYLEKPIPLSYDERKKLKNEVRKQKFRRVVERIKQRANLVTQTSSLQSHINLGKKSKNKKRTKRKNRKENNLFFSF